MTSEQRAQIQAAIRKTPKAIWGYWPFLLPTIILIVGAAVQIGLVLYFQKKIPDLEVLFKHGKNISLIADSDMVEQAVLVTSGSITTTFLMFIFLARLDFKHANLLKVAAKELGIEPNNSDKAHSTTGIPEAHQQR